MSRPSNGTMMDMWLNRWCYRCVHDHGMSHRPDGDPDQGCDLLARLYFADHDENIPELVEDLDGHERDGGWSPEHLECRLFERCPCRDDPGWEPPAKPTPDPNQGVLFDVVDETPFTPMLVIPTEQPMVDA